MMVQHEIAGYPIFTLDQIDENLKNELFNNNIRVYNKYMQIYKESNFSYFRTPYEMDPKSVGPGYQYEPENNYLKNKYKKFIINNLKTVANWNYEIGDMWYLKQPNEEWINNPPHQHLVSDYVAVTYLAASEGDHIIFYDSENTPYNYNIKEGELIIFPSYVFHKPGPSVGQERISVNAELTIIT